MRTLERLAVLAAAGLSGGLALRLLGGVDAGASALPLGAGLLAGWVAADLTSGLVHWWCDRIAREDTPLLGRSFVAPFREHHRDPSSICRYGFFETNGNTCIAMAPLLVAAWVVVPAQPGSAAAVFGSAGALSFSVWTCLTNQIHKWAHAPTVPAWVRRLQEARLLLPPEHHAGHHRSPFASHYCITAGWLDARLDRAGVFPALERWLGRRSPGTE